MDHSPLTAQESWSLLKWILGVFSSFSAVVAAALAKHYYDRLNANEAALKKMNESIQKMEVLLTAKIAEYDTRFEKKE